MKIKRFKVSSRFKNLEGIEVNFDLQENIQIIVGQNGAGKSNILEALASLFRNLDLLEPPPFSYEIEYKLESKNDIVSIKADADHKIYDIKYGSKKLSLKDLKNKGINEYLPKFICSYYSGISNRLEKYFVTHKNKFYNHLLKNNDSNELYGDLRNLFYAKPIHSQFVLLAFFLSQEDSAFNFLKKSLRVKSVQSVHFIFKKPWWNKKDKDLFWGARGTVQQFLDILLEVCIAPLKLEHMIENEYQIKSKQDTNEFLHLYLQDKDKLNLLLKKHNIQPSTLFRMFESVLLSDLIDEIKIQVKTTYGDQEMTFQELSEGEQQLLTVFGLLQFVNEKDSLFLLDEPDTHLNPQWSIDYLSMLKQFIPNQETSQILMVSHHPLSIADLKKEQIQVIRRSEDYTVSAYQPYESPQGMGVNYLLQSDMFNLKTTLDKTTHNKIKKRNQLATKDSLNSSEKIELERLNNALLDLGFSLDTDDSDYMSFLKQKYHTPAQKEH